jgi:hypothetical protein
MLLDADVDVRLWTTAPAFDGAGGVEVTGGGYIPAVLTANPSVAGTGGQIANATNQAAFLFVDMPVASTDVVAITVNTHSTGDLVWLNDSWVSPVAWSVGESPLFDVGTFAVALIPVS